MLLLDDRHVHFDKLNIAFINQSKVSTDKEELTPSDVVRLVRPLVGDLYSTDIKSVVRESGVFTVTLVRNCTVYHGTFNIYHKAN